MQALDNIANRKSLQKAVLDWGIPRFTFQDRLNLYTTYREAAQRLQKLPLALEDRLTKWVLTQETLGHSITYTQVKVFGERLCAL